MGNVGGPVGLGPMMGVDLGMSTAQREEMDKQLRMACMQMAGAMAQTNRQTHTAAESGEGPVPCDAATIVREAEILRVYVDTGARKAA